MPQEIIDTHELQTITLDYRRECQHNDMVDSLTSLELADDYSTNGSATGKQHKREHHHFLHFLRLSSTGLEINRGRTEWRKLVRWGFVLEASSLFSLFCPCSSECTYYAVVSLLFSSICQSCYVTCKCSDFAAICLVNWMVSYFYREIYIQPSFANLTVSAY